MLQNYANYEWFLKQDFTSYSGKWLAIINKKVVASGDDVAKVIKKSNKEFPNIKPLVTKVKDKLSIL